MSKIMNELKNGEIGSYPKQSLTSDKGEIKEYRTTLSGMLAKLRDTADRLDVLAEISEEVLSKLTFIEYPKRKEEVPLKPQREDIVECFNRIDNSLNLSMDKVRDNLRDISGIID